MSKGLLKIFDDAYKKYADSHEYFVDGWMHVIPMVHNKETFVNECKTNPEFAKKWGLKIEERKLSLEERAKWLQDNKGYDLLVGNLDHDHIREVVEEESPTKLITLTYNNETIEVYE